MTSKEQNYDNGDDDMTNTNLVSTHYDPTDIGDDDNQKDLGCCWCCKGNLQSFCRFRMFYFIYYVGYQCGVLYIISKLSSQIDGDHYDDYNNLFLAIAAFISFLFCIYLGYLSDINGRKKYLKLTVIITIIPYLAVLIYPNIWLYLGLIPLFGFVGSTSILTGLMITYLIDILPKQYVAAGFASIHSIEGSAQLIASGIVLLLSNFSGDRYRDGLATIFSILMFSLFIMMCCLKESLPLKKRNINANNKNIRCFQIFCSTLKANTLLFQVIILYFCILFSFQGIESLINSKSDFSDFDNLNILFIILNGGVSIGKLLNPTILCCVNCCCKKIFPKIVGFMSVLIVALIFLIVMAVYGNTNDDGGGNDSNNTSYNGTYSPTLQPTFDPTPIPTTAYPMDPTQETTMEGVDGSGSGGVISDDMLAFIFAFVAGLVLSWSKLLLPLINVLVRKSSNKLEQGRTFGVLASIESVCAYTGPLVIVTLYDTKFPTGAFIVCLVLVILGFVWLWMKIKLVLMMQDTDVQHEILLDVRDKEVEEEVFVNQDINNDDIGAEYENTSVI